MKIIVLGGFLGSGKTSVLLRLAKNIVAHDQTDTNNTVAIIENEIGEVSVDGTLLKSAELVVKEMFAGCICCSLSSDLITGIKEIQETVNPGYILIEATGLAYPGQIIAPIKDYLTDLKSIKTLTLVDAQRFIELYDILNPLITKQIETADCILINKVDTVDKQQLKQVVDVVKKIEPSAKIHQISASQGIASVLIEELLN